nr:ORF2 [Banfec anellovirus 1]
MSYLSSRARLLKNMSQDYKRQEALFRQTVTAAHKLFCSCPDPRSHLPEWRGTGETITGDRETAITGGTDAETTEALIDALLEAATAG